MDPKPAPRANARASRLVGAALAAMLGLALMATAAVPARAQPAEALIPPGWLELADAPVEWAQLVDVADGQMPELYDGVAILQPGQIIEFRVKLVHHDVPSSFAPLHATLVQVVDARGVASGGITDLGTPEMDNRELWTRYTVPESLAGGFVLALTADTAAGQPGYMIGGFPFVVLPPATDPADVVDAVEPQVVLPPPPPPPPAPVPPAPAPPPAAPALGAQPAPPAEQAAPVQSQQPADAAIPDGAVEAGYVGADAGAEPVLQAQPVRPAEYPPWLLPTSIAGVVLAVAVAIAWRVTAVLQRRASIRRLAGRP